MDAPTEFEEDLKQNEYSPTEFAKLGEIVSNSGKRELIETLLKDAKLSDNEPISYYTGDAANLRKDQVSCKVADDHLMRLNKTYPIQTSVWQHIFNESSTILIGSNIDYYPHLLYLPPICDLIQVKRKKIYHWLRRHHQEIK